MAAIELYEFHGKLVNQGSGAPVADAQIEVWDEDGVAAAFIQGGWTDAQGDFILRFSVHDMPRCSTKERRWPTFRVYQQGEATRPTVTPTLTAFTPGITRVTLSVTVRAPTEPIPAPLPPRLEDVAFPVTGRVITPAGHPVVGVKVEARLEGAARDCGEEDPSLLGEATTDAFGRFNLLFLNQPTVVRHLRALSTAREVTFRLDALEPDSRSTLVSLGRLRASSIFPVTLVTPMREMGDVAALWSRLGKELASARIAHVHHIASTLAAHGAGTPLSTLSRAERAALLLDMEGAFLDPTGVLRRTGGPIGFATFAHMSPQVWAREAGLDLKDPSVVRALNDLEDALDHYDGLHEVDWALDLEVLTTRGIDAAFSVAKDIYVTHVSGSLFPFFPPPEGVAYRDYLRAIFTGPPSSPGYANHCSTLARRLHQDFETTHDADTPANVLMVEILKAILTAPPGDGYGFGIAADAIQPQGNRTPREYLDYLIGVTGLSVEELSRRYWLDLTRADESLSSPVRENISALQAFYRDGFQAIQDPFPVFPNNRQGHAPFFLYFEEWQRMRAPFYGENHFSLRDIFHVQIWDSRRELVRHYAETSPEGDPLKLLAAAMGIEDKLTEGWKKVDLGQHALGLARFQEAVRLAEDVFWPKMKGNINNLQSYFDSHFQKVKGLPVKDADDLLALHQALGVPTVFPANKEKMNVHEVRDWVEQHQDHILFAMLHLIVWGGPALEAEVATLQGNFTQAASLLSRLTLNGIGRARSDDAAGYPDGFMHSSVGSSSKQLYGQGELPYTLAVSKKDLNDGCLPGYDALYAHPWDILRVNASRTRLNKVELRALRLRLGEALLAEAEALYRRDTGPDAGRARELYKAVFFIHNHTPPISPLWSDKPAIVWMAHQPNPAVTSQLGRALSAFMQLEAGLNFYGFSDDLVPSLRYGTLKALADRLASAARSAQQDFLFYTSKVEEALKDELTTTNLLQKADLQRRIAKEQEGIAQYGVVLAQQQVVQVQAAIDAKRKEISDHDEIVGQFKDFFKGMKGFVDDLAGLGAKDSLTTGISVGTGLSAGGGAGAASMSALAAGGMVTAGYALFIYAGITTLQSMADSQLSRQKQLEALKQKALPLAQAGVTAKEREVTIARLQEKVALADLQLAQSLLEFGRLRVLNAQVWHQLAAVARRVLGRYLDLGGRFAWQAERALAYEQNRALDIIRLAYSPEKSNGLMGAELLQADLAELEAARLMGQQQRVRSRRTFSLAFDFPMAFASLKQTGRATFSTTELELRAAHPGTTGWRIRNVSTAVQSLGPKGGARGLLTNLGFSRLSLPDGTLRPLLRPPEGQPIGEPMAIDMHGENLAPFEGSGVDTFWTIELPTAANPYGLGDLMDILLLLELEGDWSAGRYAADQAAPPAKVRRFVLLSAAKLAPQELASLKTGNPSVTVHFDVTKAGLPVHEKNRVVKNLAVAVAGASPETFSAPVGRALPSSLVLAVPFQEGIAHSNAEPFNVPGAPVEVLNAFVGGTANQTFSLTLGPSPCPGVSFTGVTDVILALEYEADIA